MALRASQGCAMTMAHASFNSGNATIVPQIGGNGVPTPQASATSFDYQTLDAAAALSVGTGSTFSDVTLEVAFDPTLGGASAKTHQELVNLGIATTKTNVTFVSSFTNGAGGNTVWTWVGQVLAANLVAAAGSGQILTCTIKPQSLTSVTFA